MIIDLIKEIALQSVDEQLSLRPILGRVTSVSPLSILIDQKISLSRENCIILSSALPDLSSGNSLLILSLKDSFIVLGGVS